MKISNEIKNNRDRLTVKYPATIRLPYGKLGCQLDCTFCHKELRDEIRETQNTKKAIFDIYSKMESLIKNARNILIVEFGEPFLVPYLGDLLDRVFSLNSSAQIRLVTNLYTYRKDIIKMLSKRGNTKLIVSLNAASRNTYSALTGIDCWEKIVQNIKELNQLKQKGYPEICLSFVGNNENIHELPEFINLAYSLKVKQIVLQDLVILHRDHERLDFTRKDIDSVREIVSKAKVLAAFLGINLSIKVNSPGSYVDNSSKQFLCRYPFSTFYLDSVGDVSLCCYSEKRFGNIFRDSPEEIWKSQEIKYVRNMFLEDKLSGDCLKCKNTFYGY